MRSIAGLIYDAIITAMSNEQPQEADPALVASVEKVKADQELDLFERMKIAKENMIKIDDGLKELKQATASEIQRMSDARLSSRTDILLNKIGLGKLISLDAELDLTQGDFVEYNGFRDDSWDNKIQGKLLSLSGLDRLGDYLKTLRGDGKVSTATDLRQKLSSLNMLVEQTRKLAK